MRILIFLIILSPVSSLYASETWIEVLKNSRVEILIDKTLYEQDAHSNFFIHVGIVNRTTEAIGVDLRDPWRIAYPNQWGGSDKDHRLIIYEIAMNPTKLDSASRQELMSAFRASKLQIVPPGQTVQYYTNFNSSGRSDIDMSEGQFVLISIKGQLFFSDGQIVWDEKLNCDFPIRKPVTWRIIPKNSTVVTR